MHACLVLPTFCAFKIDQFISDDNRPTLMSSFSVHVIACLSFFLSAGLVRQGGYVHIRVTAGQSVGTMSTFEKWMKLFAYVGSRSVLTGQKRSAT